VIQACVTVVASIVMIDDDRAIRGTIFYSIRIRAFVIAIRAVTTRTRTIISDGTVSILFRSGIPPRRT